MQRQGLVDRCRCPLISQPPLSPTALLLLPSLAVVASAHPTLPFLPDFWAHEHAHAQSPKPSSLHPTPYPKPQSCMPLVRPYTLCYSGARAVVFVLL